MKYKIEEGISDIPLVKIGHWESESGRTGLSVAILERSCTASYITLGGAPGLSEVSLLDDGMTVSKVDAILLTGGSAYGLDAAKGVRRFLREQKRGFKVGDKRVPIVPAAVIYDLGYDDKYIFPDEESGYIASSSASKEAGLKIGNVGAGIGAYSSKSLGLSSMVKSGLAAMTVSIDEKIKIGVLLVVNPFGMISSEDRSLDFLLSDTADIPEFSSTVIGIIFSNVKLSKAEAKRVAIIGSGGIARAIFPSFTNYDGDTLFCVSTGDETYDIAKVGGWAEYLIEKSILKLSG